MRVPLIERPRRRKLAQWTLAFLAGAWVALQVFGEPRDAAEHATAVEAHAAPGSIAVLPFANLSADAAQEFFSDGLTEELLNALAQVDGLRVVARTSSFAFKGRGVPVDSVARLLRVVHVLEGSVQRSADRLRINAQLIEASSGYQLWSARFDRDVRDIFAIQDEIARAIVAALADRLAPVTGTAAAAVSTRLVAQRSVSVEAHELYLRGLFHWNRRTPGELERAIRYFEQAVGIAPDYARAHAGLALVYAVLPSYASATPAAAAAKGRAAARRALVLDPTLAEAHAALGQIAHYADWNWQEAEREYQRATQLNPSFATAHQWRAELFLLQRRMHEGRVAAQRAQRLDPLSLVINTVVAVVHLHAEEYDVAIDQLQSTLELDPAFTRALHHLMVACMMSRRFDDAADAARRFAAASGLPAHALVTIARAGENPQRQVAAQRALADPALQDALGPAVLPVLLALARDDDAALASAEQTVAQRLPTAPLLVVHPALRALRSNTRYQALLEHLR